MGKALTASTLDSTSLDSAYDSGIKGPAAPAALQLPKDILPIHRKKVLFVTSELADLVKVGGLGDVSAALPRALSRYHWVRVMVPGYPQVMNSGHAIQVIASLPGYAALPPCQIGRMALADGLTLYVVICPELYERPGTPYGDANSQDWPDNHIRFARFGLAAAALASGEVCPSWQPDLVHAQAVQAVLQQFPTMGSDTEFYHRVRAGFQLNELGLGSNDIIRNFSLQDELVRMLERKSVFGQQVHSDYCKLEGRTVNEWLAEPGQMPAFLEALQARGWIKRGTDPGQSRFWHLISGPDALMFGVFTEYEQRLIYEWIANGWHSQPLATQSASQRTFKPARGSRRKASDDTAICTADRSQLPVEPVPEALDALQKELQTLPHPERMQRLISMINPSRHGTPEGLLATRMFSSQMYKPEA